MTIQENNDPYKFYRGEIASFQFLCYNFKS
jgi:hypothetical protein